MAEAPQTLADGKESGGTSKPKKAISYENYLQLDKVLDGVRRLSEENGDPAHEEHLFIVIHQAFEIWFKQMLFDMDSIIEIFDSNPAREEKHMLTITQRLERIVLIWKLLIDQFFILETMPPLDFLEFRPHLGDASGFQSLQFRLIENRFGIRENDREHFEGRGYKAKLSCEKSRNAATQSEQGKTLFNVVETWLESFDDIDSEFWQRYTKAVERLDKKSQIPFQVVIDKDKYESKQENPTRRLSHKAFKGALSISLLRDEPGYCLPYKVLTLLTDVDGLIMKWRHNHSLMVHRMIGNKRGTGSTAENVLYERRNGSTAKTETDQTKTDEKQTSKSGYEYLSSTVSERYRVFIDFFSMSTYLITRKELNTTDRKSVV